MRIEEIAASLGIKKRDEHSQKLKEASERKKRFLEAIQDDYHGREVDDHLVSDYLATVADPEGELKRAQDEYARSIKQAKLKADRAKLAEQKAATCDKIRKIQKASTREVNVYPGNTDGHLWRLASKAQAKITEDPNPATAEDYADWRQKLRAVEDAEDEVALNKIKVRKLEREIDLIDSKLTKDPTERRAPATIVS